MNRENVCPFMFSGSTIPYVQTPVVLNLKLLSNLKRTCLESFFLRDFFHRITSPCPDRHAKKRFRNKSNIHGVPRMHNRLPGVFITKEPGLHPGVPPSFPTSTPPSIRPCIVVSRLSCIPTSARCLNPVLPIRSVYDRKVAVS